jgi:hypothetical protein
MLEKLRDKALQAKEKIEGLLKDKNIPELLGEDVQATHDKIKGLILQVAYLEKLDEDFLAHHYKDTILSRDISPTDSFKAEHLFMLIKVLNKVKDYNIEPPRKVFVQSGPSSDSQDIRVLKTQVADQ